VVVVADSDAARQGPGAAVWVYLISSLPADELSMDQWLLLVRRHIVGNVREWTEDDGGHINYQGAPVDGSAWVNTPTRSGQRMVRNGSWLETYVSAFRSVGRVPYDAATQNSGTGFRLAMPVPGAQ